MRKLSDYYDIGDFIRKFLKIAVIFIPLPIFGAGFCVVDHHNNTREINRIISEIEKNIIKKTEIDNFTYSAFTLIDEVEKINVCIYGNASKNNDSQTVFSSITYSIEYNSNYDLLRSNLSNKIETKFYYNNEELIGAKNTYTKGLLKNYIRDHEVDIFTSLYAYLFELAPEIINTSFYGIVK